MKFLYPYTKGVLIKRYKRFLADIELDDGTVITAHTPNTGAMTGCSIPGSRVWVRDTANPSRKYPYSWEIVEAKPCVLVGIHTNLSNQLVQEAIVNGTIKELQNYQKILTEVPYGDEKSRVDILLKKDDCINAEQCYVEVKNVTLVEDNIAYFPDAVSARGSKHLRELIKMVAQGHRAVIFYCVQRNDARGLRPAQTIDPLYSETLRLAVQAGVKAMAYYAEVSTEEIKLVQSIPVAIIN